MTLPKPDQKNAFLKQLSLLLNTEQQQQKAYPDFLACIKDDKVLPFLLHYHEHTSVRIEEITSIFHKINLKPHDLEDQALKSMIDEVYQTMENKREDAEKAVLTELLHITHYKITCHAALLCINAGPDLKNKCKKVYRSVDEEKKLVEQLTGSL